MADREVLICNPDKQAVAEVAKHFRQLEWSVQETGDEAEAGYRLLMWNEAKELPTVAFVRLFPLSDLLDFCTVLSEEDVTEQLPIVAWVDELDLATRESFERLGLRTVQTARSTWLPIRDVLIELGLHPEVSQRVDPRSSAQSKSKAAPRFSRSSEKGEKGVSGH